MILLISIIFIIILSFIRLFVILPNRIKSSTNTKKNEIKTKTTNTNKTSIPIKTLVVLGSGGHTGEMIAMIQSLDPKKYKFIFVVADTDKDSEKYVRTRLENKEEYQPLIFNRIPRSREVHQSYFTSIFTTLKALIYTTFITNIKINPDLILVNGPGTCIPICLSGYLMRFLGIKHVKIIFVESVCRIESLSLSGKIMYYLADRFLVHWPQLQHKYPKVEYHGRLCY
ncbi:hypothetical protein ABK040_012899 [Willaertia magna]